MDTMVAFDPGFRLGFSMQSSDNIFTLHQKKKNSDGENERER
jgi:hypothetical protein